MDETLEQELRDKQASLMEEVRSSGIPIGDIEGQYKQAKTNRDREVAAVKKKHSDSLAPKRDLYVKKMMAENIEKILDENFDKEDEA